MSEKPHLTRAQQRNGWSCRPGCQYWSETRGPCVSCHPGTGLCPKCQGIYDEHRLMGSEVQCKAVA